MSPAEVQFFNQARGVFQEVDSVRGALPGEPGRGLGPAFNANSCAVCHAQPAVGGTSPGLTSPQNPVPNPQVALATLDGAQNIVPSFITTAGPVREPRFIRSATANIAPNDGSVHEIYTIRGRVDAPGCDLAQPDFEAEIAASNVILRIPTPTFGAGLVENTSEQTLMENLAATAARRAALGIAGEFNRAGNDQSIARFGWKAQNKSLEIFSGEAYLIEQGVSNELFQNERIPVLQGGTAVPPSCVFNPTPEDFTVVSVTTTTNPGPSDVTNFGIFMRLSAPPARGPIGPAEVRGEALFDTVGCAACHSPTLKTAASPFTGMSNVTFHPYSDFALHHMGANLADGIVQGVAGPDEFRSAPLWGLGQRLFFLHDGRTQDLLEAIAAHASPAGTCSSTLMDTQFTMSGQGDPPPPATAQGAQDVVQTQVWCAGSESNKVIDNFNALGPREQQDLLDFLRSL